MKFRNVVTDSKVPVERWPQEAIQAALERGSLAEWQRLARSIASAPWGPVARGVEEVLSFVRPHGVALAMEQVIADARRAEDERAREAVVRELHDLVNRSGLSCAAFASLLGTSGSRLSTYLSGRVVPSAALLVRARALADAGGSANTPTALPARQRSGRGPR